MRILALLLCLPAFNLAVQALEPSTADTIIKGDGHIQGVPFEGPRVGGDTIEDAVVASDLFTDTGNTCGFAHDYDEICPYGGSTSPDVVYVVNATSTLNMEIEICSSSYDTKLFVYEFSSGHGFGNPLACSDDFCGLDGYKSALYTDFVQGLTYYVVVDGYGGDCGDYVINMHEIIIEELGCPAGAIVEGEPECYDGYVDAYNGGCGMAQPQFFSLCGGPAGAPFDVCGTSGTFLFEGAPYRDTDWYELALVQESTITFECVAEFPLLVILLDGSGGCAEMQILANADAQPLEVVTLEYTCPPGTYWFWVGPSIFDGVACGSDYVLHISGYESQTSPAARETWGAVKERFR